MSSYYYLISTLPMPVLKEKPLLTLEEFMSSCSEWLPDSEYIELDNISLIPDLEKISKNKIINKWETWETCLRNRIAKVRSSKLGKNAAQYIQEEKNVFSELERRVQDAYSAENPMLKEKALDELRWKELDNMESGHQFDFSMLCIYKLRLMLCEKWIDREDEKGERNLDAILLHFYTAEKNNEEAVENQPVSANNETK